jgi:hypothetical protein
MIAYEDATNTWNAGFGNVGYLQHVFDWFPSREIVSAQPGAAGDPSARYDSGGARRMPLPKQIIIDLEGAKDVISRLAEEEHKKSGIEDVRPALQLLFRDRKKTLDFKTGGQSTAGM